MSVTKEDLVEAMQSITDALAFARGPRGEVLVLGDDKRAILAWHLARAGVPPVDPDRAIIKRRAMPDQPGMIAGVIDWVPVGSTDPDPQRTEQLSARGEPIDSDAMWDALPWHVKTNIKGDFK